jgi:hypothetical protein
MPSTTTHDRRRRDATSAHGLQSGPIEAPPKGEVQKIISSLRSKLELGPQPLRGNQPMAITEPHNGAGAGDPPRNEATKNGHESVPSPSQNVRERQRWKAPTRHDVDVSLLPSLFQASLIITEKRRNEWSGSTMSHRTKPPTRNDRIIERHVPKPKEVLRPRKLRRRWPPIIRKASKRALSESLHLLKSQARVRSLADSFERLSQTSFSSTSALDSDDHCHDDGKESPLDEWEEFYIDLDEHVLKNIVGGHDGHPVDPADDYKMARKASMRIRWGGPEVFLIGPSGVRRTRTRRRKPVRRLKGDRFASSDGNADVNPILMTPLVHDRFGARDGGDHGVPKYPARRGTSEWSDGEDWSDDEMSLDDGEGSIDGASVDSDDESQSCMEKALDLSVWITAADDSMILTDSNAHPTALLPSNMKWVIMRVWNDDDMDSREEEELVSSADLIERVRILLGIRKEAFEDNAGGMSPHWLTTKVWDVGGEIVSSKTEQPTNDSGLLMSLNELNSLIASKVPAALDNVDSGHRIFDNACGSGSPASDKGNPCQSESKNVTRDIVAESKMSSALLGQVHVEMQEERSIAEPSSHHESTLDPRKTSIRTSTAGIDEGGNKCAFSNDGYVMSEKRKKKFSLMSLLSPPQVTFREVEYTLE